MVKKHYLFGCFVREHFANFLKPLGSFQESDYERLQILDGPDIPFFILHLIVDWVLYQFKSVLYADRRWLVEIWVNSWLRNAHIALLCPLYVICLLLMVPAHLLAVGNHALLRVEMCGSVFDLCGWFVVDALQVKQFFLLHPMLDLLLEELWKSLFEVLVLLACLLCALLNIFCLYRLHLIQSVPLRFTLLLYLFPNQLLNSPLLSGKTESRKHQKVEVDRPEVIAAVQVKYLAANFCFLSFLILRLTFYAVKLPKVRCHLEVKLIIVRSYIKVALISVLQNFTIWYSIGRSYLHF